MFGKLLSRNQISKFVHSVLYQSRCYVHILNYIKIGAQRPSKSRPWCNKIWALEKQTKVNIWSLNKSALYCTLLVSLNILLLFSCILHTVKSEGLDIFCSVETFQEILSSPMKTQDINQLCSDLEVLKIKKPAKLILKHRTVLSLISEPKLNSSYTTGSKIKFCMIFSSVVKTRNLKPEKGSSV